MAEQLVLACSQIWGGRRVVDQVVILPGIRAAVFSHPAGGAADGGDIEYLGACARERMAKVVLADVSGHGPRAGRLAELVQHSLQESINEPRNDAFLRTLNLALKQNVIRGQFATMISLITDANTGQLRFASAAQPFLIHYAAADDHWETPDLTKAGSFPLGIVDDVSYFESARALMPNDMVVLYTDGLVDIEAADGAHRLGLDGLLTWLRAGPHATAEEVKDELLRHMADYHGSQTFVDDVTFIVLKATDTGWGATRTS